MLLRSLSLSTTVDHNGLTMTISRSVILPLTISQEGLVLVQSWPIAKPSPHPSSLVVILRPFPQPQPVVVKRRLSYPLYEYEKMAKIRARSIRHVFKCQSDSNQPCKLVAQSACNLTLTISLYSTYQRNAASIHNPPPQFYQLRATSYPPTSLSRIPLSLPTIPFEVDISCRFLGLWPLSLLKQLHALSEGHLQQY